MEIAKVVPEDQLTMNQWNTIQRLRTEYNGKTFNELTCIDYDHVKTRKRGNGQYVNLYFFKFKCSCGKTIIANISEVRNNAAKSCGHLRGLVHNGKDLSDKTDLEGYEFNEIKVIKYLKEKSEEYNKNKSEDALNKYFYLCKCSCGKEFELDRNRILDGTQKTCGHLRFKSNNLSGTRFYSIWHHLKLRCDNPNDDWYDIYGGRGITYDSRWKEFINFYDDMYESYVYASSIYGEKNISIDRIDPDGNYCKENCRWSVPIVQTHNTRSDPGITYNGINYNVDDFSKRFGLTGLSHNDIYTRIYKEKWNPMIAVTTPSEQMRIEHPEIEYPIEFFE